MKKGYFSFLVILFYYSSMFLDSDTDKNLDQPLEQPIRLKSRDDPLNKDTQIIFGQSAMLSEGSMQIYSELIRNGILARLERENIAGGIKGKTLRLISLNDDGNPLKTATNVKNLQEKGVSMFLGNTGTRSVFKLLPQIKSNEITMLFPWGGDDKLRQPEISGLVNGLGLIKPQIESLVSRAVDELKFRNISLFHDDGGFGKSNKETAVEMMISRGLTPKEVASYNRFTMNIKRPAKKLIESDPKVVICLATSQPTTKLINKFFEAGYFGTTFIGIDSTMFVGDILKSKGVNFFYASPIPDPKNSDKEIVQMYQQDSKKYFPNDPFNVLSLAYYIHASIVVEALKKCGKKITNESVVAQIESMKNFDLGGFLVDFDSQTRHAYPHKISLIKA